VDLHGLRSRARVSLASTSDTLSARASLLPLHRGSSEVDGNRRLRLSDRERSRMLRSVTSNRSGRTFTEEIRAFAAWVQPDALNRRVRVLAYDYASDTDWSFSDAPEVDAEACEAILRRATGGAVTLSVCSSEQERLVVALEYLADPDTGRFNPDASVWVNWNGMSSDGYPNRTESLGVAVLTAGRVPGPPRPPFARGVAYPLAFDMSDGIGAVSFAAFDVYPDIDRGWWCLVEQFSFHDGAWRPAGGMYDNTTISTPFERPSGIDWVEWGTDGGNAGWDEEPRDRHSYCGIASVETARLTVTSNGETRDVRITPWNGAYVVVATGLNSTLTGYDIDGTVLGTISTTNRPMPVYDESRTITIPFDPKNPPRNEPIITFTRRSEPT
jgi:hypothetical protein